MAYCSLQVASHAQKYFIRLNSQNKKDKRRASIHDITSPLPPSSQLPRGPALAMPLLPPLVPPQGGAAEGAMLATGAL